jgi:large subunit ribosomal protein L4
MRRLPAVSSENSAAASLLHYRSKASAAASLTQQPPASVPLPPNLKLDPRSSFVVKPSTDNLLVDPSLLLDETDDSRRNHSTAAARRQDDESVAENDLEDANDYDEDEDDDEHELPLFLAQPPVRYAVPLPDRLNVTVQSLFASNTSSLDSGTLWLDQRVFGCDPIRIDLLKRAVDYYRARKRGMRKAVTKTISEVSGSGRKRRQQKGTGRARMGHSRPAHHRGGAKAHGPKNVTDYGNTKLNKKVRRLALCHALSQKLLEGNLVVLNSLYELPTHKTKEFAKLLEPLGIGGRHGTTALILDSYYNATDENDSSSSMPESFRGLPVNVVVASANLANVKVGNDHQGSVYDILKHEKLVLTLAALAQLEKRLKDV